MNPIAVLLPQQDAVLEGEQLLYMAAAVLFILGIKRLSGVKTARRGGLGARARSRRAVSSASPWPDGRGAVPPLGA